MRGFQEHRICNYLRQHGDQTPSQVGEGLYRTDVVLSHKARERWGLKKLENLRRKGFVKKLPDGRYSVKIGE